MQLSFASYDPELMAAGHQDIHPFTVTYLLYANIQRHQKKLLTYSKLMGLTTTNQAHTRMHTHSLTHLHTETLTVTHAHCARG